MQNRERGTGAQPWESRRCEEEGEEASMLFAKLAMDRTLAEKNDTEDPQHKATRGVAAGAGWGGCGGSPGKDRLAARTPPSRRPPVTDSEWLDLSAGEQ